MAIEENEQDNTDLQRNNLSVKDWLWRLDCIEKRLAKILPNRNLHIAFTLQTQNQGRSSQEKFPFGHFLQSTERVYTHYQDPDTGALWIDFGGPDSKPFILCWDDDRWTLESRLPECYYRENKGKVLIPKQLGWCVWYYLKNEKWPVEGDEEIRPRPGKQKEIKQVVNNLLDIDSIEVAIGEAIALTSTINNAGTNFNILYEIGCWPTTLFYFSLCRIHPFISAWGDFVPKYLTDNKEGNPFYEAHDRMILLEPDFRTATEYAFESFRRIIESNSNTSFWQFRAISDDEVLAENHQLCQEYSKLDQNDLLVLCNNWKNMAGDFVEATKQAGHYHGHIQHAEEINHITKILETALAQRQLNGVSSLGRCLRRPDNGHLHHALVSISELEAKLRTEKLTEIKPNDTNEIELNCSSLTDTENNILEALGDDTLTGPVLLSKAGYDYSSHYRGILSNLVKRGILEKTGKGYKRLKLS